MRPSYWAISKFYFLHNQNSLGEQKTKPEDQFDRINQLQFSAVMVSHFDLVINLL